MVDAPPVVVARQQSAPTLARLHRTGLVELARYKVLGPDLKFPEEATALRQMLLIGPAGTKDKFLPQQQYECLIDTGEPADKLKCFPRSRWVHG